MKVEIPKNYMDYAGSFYPRIMDDVSTEKEFIVKGLSFLRTEKQQELKSFLRSALNGGCTIQELQEAWLDGGPRFGFDDDNLRKLLEMTLEILP